MNTTTATGGRNPRPQDARGRADGYHGRAFDPRRGDRYVNGYHLGQLDRAAAIERRANPATAFDADGTRG